MGERTGWKLPGAKHRGRKVWTGRLGGRVHVALRYTSSYSPDLDVVEDCNEKDCLCVFRRFVERKFFLSIFIGDTASSFESTNKPL